MANNVIGDIKDPARLITSTITLQMAPKKIQQLLETTVQSDVKVLIRLADVP